MLALGDLASIDDYYRPRNPEAANPLGKDILAATSALQQHPQSGAVAIDGVRLKWRVRGTPYSVFYVVRAGDTRILRVLHHAQDQRRH